MYLEGVQRRFSRLVPGMKGLSYEDRLTNLGLYSLEYRRIRGDLIETYKIIKGYDTVDSRRWFPLVGEAKTRGHNLKIRGSPFALNFFTQRAVNRPLVFNGKTKEGKTCNVDFNVKPNIHYPVRGGCALVTFEDKEGKELRKISEKMATVILILFSVTKEGMFPQIQTCVCKERILVSEIPKLLADDQLLDKLELHFSRPRNSGGEVKSIDLLEDSGNVVIAFCEDGIAERLTKKEFHQVEFRGNSRDSKDKKMRLRVSPFINGELVDVKLSNAVCERSVLLTEIPDIMDPEELQDLLEIHFQKPSMDGGEVDTFMYLPQGQSAVARFNKDERQKEYKPNLLMDSLIGGNQI
uniref:NID domain-containing protein n=1 Tax=Callorhinchus milii TaxID=7868 RepID=A0A4W3H6T9_CALMI